MPESSSFIPKRDQRQIHRPSSQYNLFLLTLISYALFAAAPLASAALFIYQKHTENQFNTAVSGLDEAISQFKQTDLDRVLVFDDRIETAKKLMNHHVSIINLLKILESGTANTVQFENLNIKRVNQSQLSVQASLVTPALDGVLFQRSAYLANPAIASSTLDHVMFVDPSATTTLSSLQKRTVKLDGTFVFSTDKILYKPAGFTDGTNVSTNPNAIKITQGSTSPSVATTTSSNDSNN